MNKPRIIIRAFTCRRDVGSACLLAGLLEQMNCAAMVTSVRDFDRTVELWKPHVVVVNTLSGAGRVKAKWPNLPAVFFEGEGIKPESSTAFIANYYKEHRPFFDAADLILLWGPRSYDLVTAELSPEDIAKVHVAGNPNLDLAKFMPESMRYDPKSKSLGFSTRFHRINDHAGRSALRTMADDDKKVDVAILQSRGFVAMIKTIRILLDRTDFKISIRPHPLEQLESYGQFKDRWFGKEISNRISVDNSVSFSQWAAKQRAILSPTSTSFLKAYILGVPVINIDRISGVVGVSRDREGQFSRAWQDAGTVPHTEEELIDLVTSHLPDVGNSEEVNRQLETYSNYGRNHSACYTAARHISEMAHSVPQPNGFSVPKQVVDMVDAISFRRALSRNPLHPNMNYRRGYHAPPAELGLIVKTILATCGESHLARSH